MSESQTCLGHQVLQGRRSEAACLVVVEALKFILNSSSSIENDSKGPRQVSHLNPLHSKVHPEGKTSTGHPVTCIFLT